MDIDTRYQLCTLFQKALFEKNFLAANFLIEKKAINVNDVDTPKEIFFKGTFIHKAVERNDVEIINFLLDKGADVNIPDKDGYTPIYYAITQRNMETTELLVERGADLNVATKGRGESPLRWAMLCKKPEIVEFLKSKGAKE